MSYLSCVPDSRPPDWVLCTKEKELPCHSLLLMMASPVLANLDETAKREDGKVAVPFTMGLQSAEKFLHWVYKRKTQDFSNQDWYDMAVLAHEWDIAGMQRPVITLVMHTA